MGPTREVLVLSFRINACRQMLSKAVGTCTCQAHAYLFPHSIMSQGASEVYSRLLLSKRHGYPLWVPEPHENLHEEYKVRIGDVGTIMNGGFDPLFSICASPNDPVNSEGVPPSLECVELEGTDVWTLQNYHNPGADIASAYIHKTTININLPPREDM